MPLAVVELERQPFAIGRKAGEPVKPWSRLQGLRSAQAVQPKDRSRRLSRAAEIGKGASLRQREIRTSIEFVANVFDYRLGCSRQCQPLQVKRRREQRVLVNKHKVPTGQIAPENP